MSAALDFSRDARAPLRTLAFEIRTSAGVRGEAVCAWCSASAHTPMLASRPQSHGICPACLGAQLAGLARIGFAGGAARREFCAIS